MTNNDNSPAGPSQDEGHIEEFHRRIEQYVTDAENHLKVPHGTIGWTISETDFVFVLKMCGVLEPLIREAVRESVRRAIEHPKTATSGSDSLIKAINDLGIDRLRTIHYEFGGIDSKTNLFIGALFAVRNRYAHHIANAPLSVRELCEKISSEPNGDKTLIRKLLCWDAKHEPPQEFIENLRIFMFYNIAFFLREALHFVNPPPLLGPGILSSAFEEIAGNRNVELAPSED
jgi:hypothetical protein